jgi:hypothetical protein
MVHVLDDFLSLQEREGKVNSLQVTVLAQVTPVDVGQKE